jgi:hypothetical protein
MRQQPKKWKKIMCDRKKAKKYWSHHMDEYKTCFPEQPKLRLGYVDRGYATMFQLSDFSKLPHDYYDRLQAAPYLGIQKLLAGKLNNSHAEPHAINFRRPGHHLCDSEGLR